MALKSVSLKRIVLIKFLNIQNTYLSNLVTYWFIRVLKGSFPHFQRKSRKSGKATCRHSAAVLKNKLMLLFFPLFLQPLMNVCEY